VLVKGLNKNVNKIVLLANTCIRVCIGGAVAEWFRALGFKDEGRVFESCSGHCVVFLGKTFYSDFTSPPRCINGYLILFRIGEGKGSEGEEMGAALITLAP